MNSKLLLPTIFLIAVGSFAFAEAFVGSHREATFYLLHTRAWELMIGAICAVLMMKAPPQGSSVFGLLGLALIVGSYFLLNDRNPMPSAWSLPLVAGTGLFLVFARSYNIAGRLMSFPPLVWIGLISYSAYLWHQPVLAFARIRATVEPDWYVMMGLVVLSFVLAALTWRFVEQPFRSGREGKATILPRRGPLLATAAFGICAFASVGLLLHVIDGAPSRMDPKTLETLASMKERNPRRDICHQGARRGESLIVPPPKECITPTAGAKGEAVIIGDSHADAIAYPVRKMLEDAGWRVTELTVVSCVAFLGIDQTTRACGEINSKIYAYIDTIKPRIIVTAGRSQFLYHPYPFDNGIGGYERAGSIAPYIFDRAAFRLEETTSREEFLRTSILESIRNLADMSKALIVVEPIPEAGWNVPVWLARNSLVDGTLRTNLATPRHRYNERAREALSVLSEIERPDVIFINTESIFCHDDVCENMQDGKALYYDDDHLSLTGAQLIADAIKEKLPQIEELIAN